MFVNIISKFSYVVTWWSLSALSDTENLTPELSKLATFVEEPQNTSLPHRNESQGFPLISRHPLCTVKA